MTLPSHMTTGMPSGAAAIRTGTATYPPVVKMAAGRSAARMAVACGTEAPEPDRVEDGVDVGLGRPQRTGSQTAHGDAGRRDELRLEATMATEPAQVGRVVVVSPGAE